jgi:hypothetical protein
MVWRVVALALLAFALLAGAAQAGKAERCNGSRSLCDRRLDQVVLPSTHNSMSAGSLGFQLPNQQVGIPDQLRLGVRGFLIDTYYGVRRPDGSVVNATADSPGRRLYLCHVTCTLGATKLISALRSVRDFLRAHPREVLVFVNEDHVSARDFAKVVKRSGLGRYVYRGEPGPRWPKLRRMIDRRRQVLLLAESNVQGVRWYHPAYQGILQETPYSWATVAQLTDPAQLTASCRPNRGGTTGSLFLLNHWSPPFPASDATAIQVNAKDAIVRRAKACRAARGTIPNIVAVDRFQTGGLFAAVRKLNRVFAP